MFCQAVICFGACAFGKNEKITEIKNREMKCKNNNKTRTKPKMKMGNPHASSAASIYCDNDMTLTRANKNITFYLGLFELGDAGAKYVR